jgi:hypothetical protein
MHGMEPASANGRPTDARSRRTHTPLHPGRLERDSNWTEMRDMQGLASQEARVGWGALMQRAVGAERRGGERAAVFAVRGCRERCQEEVHAMKIQSGVA